MVGTHRTYINRLDAPYSAIVLELDTREIAQRISHRMGTQLLQLLAAKGLRRYHLLMIIARRYNNFINILDAVKTTVLGIGSDYRKEERRQQQHPLVQRMYQPLI